MRFSIVKSMLSIDLRRSRVCALSAPRRSAAVVWLRRRKRKPSQIGSPEHDRAVCTALPDKSACSDSATA